MADPALLFIPGSHKAGLMNSRQESLSISLTKQMDAVTFQNPCSGDGRFNRSTVDTLDPQQDCGSDTRKTFFCNW
jgi:hypothetical protein